MSRTGNIQSGINNIHTSASHKITKCLHDDHSADKKAGGPGAPAEPEQTPESVIKAEKERIPVYQMLYHSLKQVLSKGMGFLSAIWNDGNVADQTAANRSGKANHEAMASQIVMEQLNLAAQTVKIEEEQEDFSAVENDIGIGQLNVNAHTNMDTQTKQTREEASRRMETENREESAEGDYEFVNSIAVAENYLLHSYNREGDHSLLGGSAAPSGYAGNLTDGNFATKA